MSILTKSQQRERRHRRVRAKIFGTATRPRLSVYKTNTRLIAQLIDDERGMTLVAASSAAEKGATSRERVERSATALAHAAIKKGIETAVFDRGGFKYVGIIKTFADAARAAGLRF